MEWYIIILYKMENERIAITLGDAGENHAGMEMIGIRGDTGTDTKNCYKIL